MSDYFICYYPDPDNKDTSYELTRPILGYALYKRRYTKTTPNGKQVTVYQPVMHLIYSEVIDWLQKIIAGERLCDDVVAGLKTEFGQYFPGDISWAIRLIRSHGEHRVQSVLLTAGRSNFTVTAKFQNKELSWEDPVTIEFPNGTQEVTTAGWVFNNSERLQGLITMNGTNPETLVLIFS